MSEYKNVQIGEFVNNRSTSPNMAWIEKNKPAFAIKDTTRIPAFSTGSTYSVSKFGRRFHPS